MHQAGRRIGGISVTLWGQKHVGHVDRKDEDEPRAGLRIHEERPVEPSDQGCEEQDRDGSANPRQNPAYR